MATGREDCSLLERGISKGMPSPANPTAAQGHRHVHADKAERAEQYALGTSSRQQTHPAFRP
ncbi:MAG: hypothetical protein ACK5HA_14995, partial [Planctomycetaceae bacterium]